METRLSRTLLALRVWAERLIVFFKRELRIRASYRMTMIVTIVNGVSGILAYGFLGSSAIGSVTSTAYNMSLASYLVSGVAFSPIVTSGLSTFSQYSSPSEIEDILVTPIGFRGYILASSLFRFLTTLAGTALFFGTSIFLLGLDYSYNLPLLAFTVLLGVVMSISIGFLALGMRLVYKQTALLSWLLFSMTGLVGNMIVPVQVLPEAVRYVTYITPQYYFFTVIRIALGNSAVPVTSLLVPFALYSILLFGASLYVLSRGLKFVKRNGTHRWT